MSISLCIRRLLASRSRWAGYLQSLPTEQYWNGIALFWGFTTRDDALSSRDASDGIESDGLDSDGDAVEAKRWLNGAEAQVHFFLPGQPRTLLLVRPFQLSPANCLATGGTVELDDQYNHTSVATAE